MTKDLTLFRAPKTSTKSPTLSGGWASWGIFRVAVGFSLLTAAAAFVPQNAFAQEEAPVGGLAVGLGYGSDENGSIRGRLWHDQFLGLSQQVDLGFYLTERQQSFDLQYTNDSFTSSTPSLGIALRHSEVDMGPRFGFSTRRSSIVPHLDWPRSGARPPIRISLGLSSDEFRDITTAPRVILAEPRERTAYALGVESVADMDWYRWNARLALVGDDEDMSLLRFNGDIYASTEVGASNTQLSARFSAGTIHVLEGATTFHDRFLPSTGDLRGFSHAGFGPVDPSVGGGAALGITSFATLQLDARRAGLISALPLLEIGVFLDIGTAWGLDDGNQAVRALIDDDADLRASAGLTVGRSFGPARFDLVFASPLQRETSDRFENIQINFATEF